MLFTNLIRRSAWASVAAFALLGTGCVAQQGSTPQATASVDRPEGLAPGIVLNVGQGTYTVPALPPSANDTSYADDRQILPQPWPQPEDAGSAAQTGRCSYRPRLREPGRGRR